MGKAKIEPITWSQKRSEIIGFFDKRLKNIPQVLLILGSSLGDIAETIGSALVIPYKDIPYLPQSTATTHKGNLVLGRLYGKEIAVMQGRLHLYEGYDVRETTLLVNVLGKMGCKVLITTNLVGGITIPVGEIMLITDHDYSHGPNPLIGMEDQFEEKQFLNMINAYSPRLIQIAEEEMQKFRIKINKGILGYLTGPSFETRAELCHLKRVGVDTVGWSVCPEVIVARYYRMEVLGMSIISDSSDPDTAEPVDLEKLFEEGKKASVKAEEIIHAVLKRL